MGKRIGHLFVLFLLSFFLLVSHSFALGVAPSSFHFDYESGAEYADSILVVNTMDMPVVVEISSDDQEGIIDFLGVSSIELLAGASQKVPFTVTFPSRDITSSREISLLFSEQAAIETSISSFVSISSTVYLDGVIVLDDSLALDSVYTQEDSSEETFLEDVDSSKSDFSEDDNLESSVDSSQAVNGLADENKKSSSSLTGNDLERIHFDNNSGKLFLGITLLIVLILLSHMVYRFLHPKHDF